jgi:WD40 repeat protein
LGKVEASLLSEPPPDGDETTPRASGELKTSKPRLLMERLGLMPSPPAGHAFHAFMSYSHAADGRLAPALQKGLQQFAKPWYRARALHIFRDDASLPVTSHLWGEVQTALDASEHFILLASPQAASSEWVGREAQRWRDTKRCDELLIALTDGELAWNDQCGDFDWRRTDALPRTLAGAFVEEPRYVDLRWARGATALSLNHPRFRDAVVDLAAPLHGKPKDELASEEVVQQRRAVRVRRAATAALAALTTAAITAGVLALRERAAAIDQAHNAQSELLVNRAVETSDLGLASLFAVEAYRFAPTVDARSEILTLADNHQIGGPIEEQGTPLAVAFIAGGKAFVSAEDNGVVRFWDLVTRRELGGPLGRPRRIAGMAISSTGRTFAAANDDNDTVAVWDLVTRRQIGAPIRLTHNGFVDDVELTPDGMTLAVGSEDHTIQLWDAATHRKLATLRHTGTIQAMAMSSKALASIDRHGTIRLWALDTYHEIGTPLKSHAAADVDSVAVSSDGETLALAYLDGTIRLWNLEKRSELGSLDAGVGPINAVAFSPDGKILASGGLDRKITLWSVETLRQLGEPLAGHSDSIYSIAFSPDGKTLASGGSDNTVRLWTVADPRQLGAALGRSGSPYNLAGTLYSLAFSPDGKTLASGGYGRAVRLWDIFTHHERGPPLTGHSGPVNSVAFSPDGNMLAAADGGLVRLWEVTTRRQLGALLVDPSNSVSSVAFSPDGRTLAAAAGGLVRVSDVTTHRQLGAPLVDPSNSVSSVAFSPDGRTLAAADDGGLVRLWDMTTHRQLGAPLASQTGCVLAVAFSPHDNVLASGGCDQTVRLWDLATKRQLGAPFIGHTVAVLSVAFSPDGTMLATTGGDDTVRLWDVGTHRQLGPALTGDRAVAFTTDGKMLASAQPDKTIRFWTNYPVQYYIHQLCRRVDLGTAQKLWRQAESSIPYQRPC